MVINLIVTDEKGRENDFFSSNLENRIVYLTREVTDEMAALVVAKLLYLASRRNEDIQLYINRPAEMSVRVWRSMTPCSASRPHLGLTLDCGTITNVACYT